MAGHSKWANIQHRKGAQDKKRGAIFTKLVREITVAARMGGADPAMNPRLRLAVDKANAQSMPKDNIERAIKKGAGLLEGETYEEVTYEGYAAHGVAVLVECMTDNRNRTVAEVRHAFSKHGGNLGTEGSVAFQFERTGVLLFAPGVDADALLEVALEAGAKDIVTYDDGSAEVLTEPADFEGVREALIAAEMTPDDAELTMRPQVTTPLAGEERSGVEKLLERLEELDDTQNVYSNLADED
ncbi:MAG: YebC/PmpR family DNA-binding transcriptional regulator [Oceanococcaceae bacterium]